MKNAALCLAIILSTNLFSDLNQKNVSLSNAQQQKSLKVIEDYSKMSKAELNAAFILAVKKHQTNTVQKLIKAGADVNTQIPYVWTSGDCDWDMKTPALEFAIRHHHRDMAKIFIQLEKNPNKALDLAIRADCSDMIKDLVKAGAKVNRKDENETTPLFNAINGSYLATVKELIKAGANVNCKDKNKNTPLIKAIQRQGESMIQLLLNAGANVTYSNQHGKTALMEAVRMKDFKTVQKLLKVPAIHAGSFFGFGTKPINSVDEDGNTALMLAIKNVRYSYYDTKGYNACITTQKIVKVLTETPGIDPHPVNKYNETAVTLLEELNKNMQRY